MELCVNAAELRRALKDIEQAEANGLDYCLAVFALTPALIGDMVRLSENTAYYVNLWERAHPTDGNLDWGRGQEVSRRYRYVGGKLVEKP